MINKSEAEIIQNWQGSPSTPLVSICCITYNHENYISEALDSFLMQETDFPFEVIIRDDASTDGTANIIREYEKSFPNIIKPIYEQENGYQKGIKALPVTLKKSKGGYIAVCEGDDYWTDPNKLKIQITEMKKYPEVDMSFHPAYTVLNNKTNGITAQHSKEDRIYNTSEVIIGDGDFCPTASLIFKKELLDKLPSWYFTIAPVGDYYLQIFGSINGGLLYTNRLMSAYRTHGNNWSTTQKDNKNKLAFIKANLNTLDHLYRSLNSKFKLEIEIIKNRNVSKVCFDQIFPPSQRRQCFLEHLTLLSTYQKIKFYLVYYSDIQYKTVIKIRSLCRYKSIITKNNYDKNINHRTSI